MKSAIPPTEYNRIIQTKLSPKTIVALLNEAENTYSDKPLHYNQKRRYPFWKACQMCGDPFQVQNGTQAIRNKYCGRGCISKAISKANSGGKPPSEREGMVELTCSNCHEAFYRERTHAKRSERNFCGRPCYGEWRSQNQVIRKHLQRIASKGRDGWTEESMESYLPKMSGKNNPAWKGGVTYFRKKGNYGKYRIKYVRCPKEYLPMARQDGYVMEHRLIVAQHLGRCLKRSEVIHHKDHNPENNDPHNLMLFASNSQHKKYEAQGQPAPLWRL